MALLKVLHYPDPRLKNVGEKVTAFDESLQQLVQDMIETMDHNTGVGLAATQVGIALQLAVIDISEERNQRMVMINPHIEFLHEKILMPEGCLSVPGTYDKVPRAQKLKLKAQDQFGQSYEIEAEGLLAHCIQHEYDHLQGKLYIDYLSQLKRERIRAKLEKFKRQAF